LVYGDAKGGRNGFVAGASEITQFNDARGQGIFNGETGKRLVERKKKVVRIRRWRIDQFQALPTATVSAPPLPSSCFYEDSSHRLRGGREEMAPAIPMHVSLIAHQTQIGLMDQRGRLERLAGLFVRQLLGGQSAQFVVHDRQKPVGGGGIALFNGVQDVKNVVHIGSECLGNVAGASARDGDQGSGVCP
jgi:hypothetical protein